MMIQGTPFVVPIPFPLSPRYNVEITNVQRRSGTGKTIIIKYRIPLKGQKHRYRQYTTTCRELIVAIPSTLDKLTKFNLDAAEIRVFSQVRHINYYTALVNVPKSNITTFLGYIRPVNDTGNALPHRQLPGVKPPPPKGYVFVEPPGDSKPMLYTFFGSFANSQYATYYAYQDGEPLPKDQFEQIGLTAMSLLNHPIAKPPPGQPLTKDDYIKSFYWYYFPYFDTTTITNTIFAELEALQGYRNTYWLSSLRCFEIMEDVIMSAYDIVDRFF